MSDRRLRVAFLAGTLGTGGAEKQLVYLVAGLRASGADVSVFSLTQGEAHEASLSAMGVRPDWVGRSRNPVFRVAALAKRLRPLRPHVVHSGHFYTNLHVTLSARAAGALSIGTVRSNGVRDLGFHPVLGRALVRWPDGLIVNSEAARENVARLRTDAEGICVLPNVLDIEEFDRKSVAVERVPGMGAEPTVILVGRLVRAKRVDRFLRVLALAGRTEPSLRGLVVGDGPERAALETLARELDLLPERVRFVGERADVPALLSSASMLVLTSDEEGFPNVLLEAMAARLPIVATPAGDTRRVLRDGVAGEVVPFDDVEALAAHVVTLARSPARRAELGNAGRLIVEREYSAADCGRRALAAYASVARSVGRGDVARLIAA